MNFKCNAVEFADALGKVIKAVPARVVLPINECVKIDASAGSVVITATDNTFSIEKIIVADVLGTGVAVVPGKLLFEFIRKIGAVQIEVELSYDNSLVLKYGDGETKIRCMHKDEFPAVFKYEYDSYIRIRQKDFTSLINKVIFSAPNDDGENRRNIKGCLIENKNNVLTLVALDGYRLAVAKSGLETEEPDIRAVVPAKNLIEIARLLDEDDAYVTVYISQKRMLVDGGHIKITTGLYGDEFFEYKNIIATDGSTVIRVNKKQLLDSLERAFIMSRAEKSYQVKFEIRENYIGVLSNGGMGDVNEKVPAALTGKDLIIAFNSKFITDCLKAVDDEFIKISFTNSTTPCIIEPAEGEGYLYLVIPIKLIG